MNIDELLIEFDEMGFAPTTLCENPDEYACEWKRQLVAEIERLINVQTELQVLNAKYYNEAKLKELQEVNYERRTEAQRNAD